MTEVQGSNHGPLAMMDQHEREDRPTSGIITNIGRDLKILSADIGTVEDQRALARLADEVDKYTKQFRPMLRLTYGESPTPNLASEGRGFYLEIPYRPESHDSQTNNGLYAYVKGIGNKDILGFPTENTKNIMHDSVLAVTDEPRPKGTMSLKRGTKEYAMTLFMLLCAAKKIIEDKGSCSVSDLINAKVTIPIGVASFPQLTERIQEVIRERIMSLSDEDEMERKERELLLKQKDLHALGSIGFIVSGHERIGTMWDSVDDDSDRHDKKTRTAKKATDPDIAAGLAEKMREDLELGFVYCRGSSHGQNRYVDGAQADLGDLVALGDAKDEKKQAMLIYNQLSRNNGLVPLAFPRARLGISSEVVDAAQAKFWEKLLNGIAHPNAISRLPYLMHTMRMQINLATALLIVEKLDSKKWEEGAKLARKIVGKYSNYGALAQLNDDFGWEFSEDRVLSFEEKIGEDDPNGVQAMLKFLRSGDESFLSSPRLMVLKDLADAIEDIPEPKTRERLLEAAGRLQFRRYAVRYPSEYSKALDPVESRHYVIINEAIRSGNYDRGQLLIEILTGAVRMKNTEIDRSENKPSRFYFASALLADNPNLVDLLEELELEESSRLEAWLKSR